MASSTGDAAVDAALAGLAGEDPDAAEAARAGFESLTWGQGLTAVTAHGLADFLWCQLPRTFRCELPEKLRIAHALGDLFARVACPRYAAMCRSPETARILATYQRHGDAAGLRAYRRALSASGVEPPDLPGTLAWGTVMGADEAYAYHGVSALLERAVDAGDLVPGARGWRTAARRITRSFLDSPHDDVTGTTWLQWLHTERLQHWTESGGPAWARLAGPLGDRLTTPVPVPPEAEQCLAPLRWLLGCAADGAPLTRNGNLARAVVADGCRRFGWVPGNPRSEDDAAEVRTVRNLAQQAGALRRSGRLLVLSRYGRELHRAATGDLWLATMAALPGPGEAAAAAAEAALVLVLAGRHVGDRAFEPAVARLLAEHGWRDRHTGQELTSDQAGRLTAPVRRRLWTLALVSPQPPAAPLCLTAAGLAAAHTALRARALRPCTHPAG